MENWKPVVGYEGFYEVSDYGRIRTVEHVSKSSCRNGGSRKVPSHLLKQNEKRNGYLMVDLCKEGKIRTTLVHRIVADAFLGPEPQLQVNHKNLNKKDNRVANLEWVSAKENSTHRVANGAQPPCPHRKKVRCVERNLVFDSSYQAAEWVNATDKQYCGNVPVMARGIRSAVINGGSRYGYQWRDVVE